MIILLRFLLGNVTELVHFAVRNVFYEYGASVRYLNDLAYRSCHIVKLPNQTQTKIMDLHSCGGSVDRAVASDTRDPRFKY